MILAHKIALDPTTKQRIYFSKACGCARFVYNQALEMWNTEYKITKKTPKATELRKKFNETKYEKYPWMNEIHRDAHSQPFSNLQTAWSRYFKKLGEKPKFKKKFKRDRFYVANDKFYVNEFIVTLPIIGEVRLMEKLRFEGKIMGAVVSRQADKWFIAIQVDIVNPERKRTGNGTAGIDLGVTTAVVVANQDNEIRKQYAPKPLLKNLIKLSRLNRSLSRKTKKSNNWKKQKVKLSRLHAKIANSRKNFWDKVTTRLCRENQTIVIETLGVSGMMKNRKLARSIGDVGFSMPKQQLKYKCVLYGCELIEVSQWYPSSKTCSQCGSVKNDLSLKDRVFHCSHCGMIKDRDENAAINLCHYAKTFKNKLPLVRSEGEDTLGERLFVTNFVEPRTKTCVEIHTP